MCSEDLSRVVTVLVVAAHFDNVGEAGTLEVCLFYMNSHVLIWWTLLINGAIQMAL